jgi:hypothetical protein
MTGQNPTCNEKPPELPAATKKFFEWAENNGIILLPCKPKSKEIDGKWLSTKAIYHGKTLPDGDTFHNPTPERLRSINLYWELRLHPKLIRRSNEEEFSASVDMNYPTTDGYTVACIDVDSDDLYDDALTIPLFSTCPAIRGKKGVKFLFKLDAGNMAPEPIQQFYFPSDLEDPQVDEKNSHPALEVFTHGKHALIFGEHQESTPEHPIFYRFVRDGYSSLPILKWKDVKETIESFVKDHNLAFRKKSDRVPAPRKVPGKDTPTQYPSTHHFPVEKFLMPTNATRNGHDIQGGHPVHGSSTGMNLTIDTQGNQWHCFRCQSGGGELEAAAVAAGIIDCSDARPGWRTLERMSALREWLQEQGYEIPRSMFAKVVKPITVLDTNVHETETLPKEFPDTPVIFIKAPPRSGKTHTAVTEMCKYHSANYFTHSHSVAEHATTVIFREIRLPNQTGVHLEGRQRCCKMPGSDCQACTLNPYNSIDRDEFEQLMKDILTAAKVLTKENAPEDFCPYYVLREAAKSATHVFTVVDYLSTTRPREFTVIDEDTTISKFYPSSIELLEVYNRHKSASVNPKFDDIQSRITEIKGHIDKKRKRLHLKTVDSQDKASTYTILLKCIEIITRVCDVLCNVGVNVNPDEVVTIKREEVVKKLNEIDYTLPDGDRFRARKMAREIEFDLKLVNSFLPFIEPILFPFEKMRFAWIGANPGSLYMLADEKTLIVDPPSGKLMIIGDTRAELFIESLKREYSVVSVNRFSHAEQFILAAVTTEKLTKGKDGIKRLIHQLNPDVNSVHRVPCLVLTGSEKEAEKIVRHFGGLAHLSKDENRIGQMWNHAHGGVNVFYQCSGLSRGIDIEFYHILVAYGTNFVNPYWYAVKKVADEEKDNVNSELAQQVMDSVLIDETTNSILRISPTQRKNDGQPRIVFIHENDLWKVRGSVQTGMHVAAVNSGKIPEKVLAQVQKSIGVALQFPKGYSAKDYNYSVVYNTEKGAEKDPEWTIGDYLKGFENKEAPVSDLLSLIPPHVLATARQIQMTYLQRRLKIGRRDSEDSLIRYTARRLPKKSPDMIKELAARESITRLVKDGYVGKENDLNGVPLLHLVKTDVATTRAVKRHAGVEAEG